MSTTFPFMFDELTYELFLSILGSPFLIGLFALIFIYVFGLVLKLSFEMMTLALFFGIAMLVLAFIPALGALMVIGVGVFIGLYFFYKIYGR